MTISPGASPLPEPVVTEQIMNKDGGLKTTLEPCFPGNLLWFSTPPYAWQVWGSAQPPTIMFFHLIYESELKTRISFYTKISSSVDYSNV
jgi:hypothetical protein